MSVSHGVYSYSITPTTVDLFRYSAATNNPHRVHYDQTYAQSEGHSDILVHGHLRGAYFAEAVLRRFGYKSSLERLSVDLRRPAYVNQELIYKVTFDDPSVDEVRGRPVYAWNCYTEEFSAGERLGFSHATVRGDDRLDLESDGMPNVGQ